MTGVVLGDRSLAVLPPDEICTQIDRWRRLYDPLFELVPPHITVAYPPFVSEEEWPAVQPALARWLGEFSPFSIRLQGLGSFSGDSFVLWLKPEDGGNLVRIRARLEEQFPQYVRALPFDYVPHLTIGSFRSEAGLNVAREVVQVEIVPSQFEVDELVYLSPDHRGVWCICQRVALGPMLADDRSYSFHHCGIL